MDGPEQVADAEMIIEDNPPEFPPLKPSEETVCSSDSQFMTFSGRPDFSIKRQNPQTQNEPFEGILDGLIQAPRCVYETSSPFQHQVHVCRIKGTCSWEFTRKSEILRPPKPPLILVPSKKELILSELLSLDLVLKMQLPYFVLKIFMWNHLPLMMVCQIHLFSLTNCSKNHTSRRPSGQSSWSNCWKRRKDKIHHWKRNKNSYCDRW